QSRTFGKCHLHDVLIGFACADDSVARPNWNSSPLPLLDDIVIGFLDEVAEPAEHCAPPVGKLLDSLIDQLRGRFGLLGLLHARFSCGNWSFTYTLISLIFTGIPPLSPFAPCAAL